MSADILGMGTEAGRGAGEVKTGDAGSKVAFASGQGLEESKGEKAPPVHTGEEEEGADDDWDPNSSLEQLSKSLLLGGPEVQSSSSRADKGLAGELAQPSLTGFLIREEGSVSFRPATKVSQRINPLISLLLYYNLTLSLYPIQSNPPLDTI